VDVDIEGGLKKAWRAFHRNGGQGGAFRDPDGLRKVRLGGKDDDGCGRDGTDVVGEDHVHQGVNNFGEVVADLLMEKTGQKGDSLQESFRVRSAVVRSTWRRGRVERENSTANWRMALQFPVRNAC
jgi:hypothetical protein